MLEQIEKLKGQLGQLSTEEREKVVETVRTTFAVLEPNDDYIRFLHEVFSYPLQEPTGKSSEDNPQNN